MSTSPPPQVQQNAPAPTGNIPANRRQWIAVGACLLLVVAIALSSLGGPASPKPKSNGLPTATVKPMTPAELETATRNLKQQQIEVEQARQKADWATRRFAQSVPQGAPAAGSLDSNLQGGLPGQPVIGPNGTVYYPAGAERAVVTPQQQQPTAQDAIRLERAKREYASLFSSNVALSLRPEHTRAGSTNETPATHAAQNFALPELLPSERISSRPPVLPTHVEDSVDSAAAVEAERQEVTKSIAGIRQTLATARTEKSSAKADPELERLIADREVPKHVIFEGTILEAVLTNRLVGDFSGPVNCMVTTSVYSHNRQLLLIPQGSRILGETKKVSAQNQERLAVVFHRLIMPDGFSVDLDQFQGLDQVGAAALKDKVDHHYLQVFGTSVALGLLSGFELVGTASAFNATGIDLYRQGVSSQTAQNGTRVLERELNRLPTVTIREGQRVKVYLSKDISLPAYAAHAPAQGL